MIRKTILLLLVAGLLSACASRPQHIEGRPMSAKTFLDLDCKAVSGEVFATVEETQDLVDEVDRLADANHVRNTAWWVAFPVTLVEPYDNGRTDQSERLEHLKGRYLAAQQAAQFNGCDQVTIRPLAYYLPARYQSEDDVHPYAAVKLGQYPEKVLGFYDASKRDEDTRFREAIELLDSYYKLEMITRQEYRYTVGLLLERHMS
ncbi:MAG: hypothetical protein R3298_06755 [Gammaproteobacteria bacterium]|nr:hypothetical protein [Gammaproteobacteria bacterium]